jgi:hypothetical protein
MGITDTIGRAAAGAFVALSALAGAAQAQSQPGVVVELYTSQGCSSCPPADDFFAQLVDDPAVIPLALHVDYWDYLGWKDSFARPEHAKRQKAYAKANGSKMLYTPQIVVNGSDFVVGNSPGEVTAALARHMAAGSTIRLTVTREGDRIVIRAEAVPPQDVTVKVQLVRFRPEESVSIEHGENAGHTIDYHNIVTAWDQVTDWQAVSPLTAEVPLQGPEPAVVILQAEGMGEILAAAVLR